MAGDPAIQSDSVWKYRFFSCLNTPSKKAVAAVGAFALVEAAIVALCETQVIPAGQADFNSAEEFFNSAAGIASLALLLVVLAAVWYVNKQPNKTEENNYSMESDAGVGVPYRSFME